MTGLISLGTLIGDLLIRPSAGQREERWSTSLRRGKQRTGDVHRGRASAVGGAAGMRAGASLRHWCLRSSAS